MIVETEQRQAPSEVLPSPLAANEAELAHANGRWGQSGAQLSILIPTFRDSAHALINRLAECDGAVDTEVIVYDDGSGDPELTALMSAAVDAYPGGACLITALTNKGRSAGRNHLEETANAEWHLFLDADMYPDDVAFLSRYVDAISSQNGAPCMIVGGFSLNFAPFSAKTDLHRAQSLKSECIPAETRNLEPGRFVFTSNVLVHRHIMETITFDPAFSGWGWEDVDWGLRVADRYPVLHIDNTATHLGLDPASVLISKYEKSAGNFWLAAERHEDAMKATPLYRMSRRFARLPGRALLAGLSKQVALLPASLMPAAIRLACLKVFRAAVYGGHDYARR